MRLLEKLPTNCCNCRVLKRLTDLLLALLLISLLSPLMVVIALLVLFSGRGGVFYSQSRVGQHNTDFKVLKFRTMKPGADRAGLLTVGDRDPRVTRVGRWLRHYKLDELPQLFNVVAGQMSLVGPRPEVRRYVDLYSPDQMKVLSVRPGITDPASIEFIDENALLGASDNPEQTYIVQVMPRKLELNLKYLQTANWIADLTVLLKTVKAIFR